MIGAIIRSGQGVAEDIPLRYLSIPKKTERMTQNRSSTIGLFLVIQADLWDRRFNAMLAEICKAASMRAAIIRENVPYLKKQPSITLMRYTPLINQPAIELPAEYFYKSNRLLQRPH
jgi:hypothetical protein